MMNFDEWLKLDWEDLVIGAAGSLILLLFMLVTFL